MTRIGVLLPTFDPFRTGQPRPIVEFARRAEQFGFDGLWTGDHLWCPSPVLDAVTALAACAGVTGTVDLGLSVMLLGMRPAAWTAKQLATLQHLSGNRLKLGVGIGGEFPQEYEAAGVPIKERGRLLDAALEQLPALLRGEGAGLEPSAPMPPLVVGGRSDVAMRRAVRFGDAWLPMWISPDTLSQRLELLRELADQQRREPPSTALLMLVRVDSDRERGAAQADGHLRGQYGMALERVRRWTGLGAAQEIAEFIDRYVEVGVQEFVLMPLGPDQLSQLEGLADVLGRIPSLAQSSGTSQQGATFEQH